MRGRARTGQRRAFTLVELLVVTSMVAVLAALALFGVRRYLVRAKTSEARATVGAIARAAQAAYERESASAEEIAEGSTSTASSHRLCSSATSVPSTVPKATKYQPKTVNGADFDTGDSATGWKCLRFRIAQPHAYQYGYTQGAVSSGGSNGNGNNGNANGVNGNGNGNGNNGNGNGNGGSNNAPSSNASANPNACTTDGCFQATAFGDLDGDGVTSEFSLTGRIANGELKMATQIFVANEWE